jgi:polyisoprenoid-binding protein YceI
MVIKNILAFAVVLFFTVVTHAQERYFTKTGKIEFYSKAPLEDITAKNSTVMAVLDKNTGAFQFGVQMKSFEFERALMQQHFNSNYVESDKYPQAEFRGAIANNAAVNYSRNGSYPVTVKGKLTLHNVTKNVEVPGTIKVENGKIGAVSSFNIKLSDYKIAIPSPVKDKVSNAIKITVDTTMEPLKG